MTNHVPFMSYLPFTRPMTAVLALFLLAIPLSNAFAVSHSKTTNGHYENTQEQEALRTAIEADVEHYLDFKPYTPAPEHLPENLQVAANYTYSETAAEIGLHVLTRHLSLKLAQAFHLKNGDYRSAPRNEHSYEDAEKLLILSIAFMKRVTELHSAPFDFSEKYLGKSMRIARNSTTLGLLPYAILSGNPVLIGIAATASVVAPYVTWFGFVAINQSMPVTALFDHLVSNSIADRFVNFLREDLEKLGIETLPQNGESGRSYARRLGKALERRNAKAVLAACKRALIETRSTTE